MPQAFFICELLWPFICAFMHSFIHSFIHFNSNEVSGSVRGSEDSAGNKVGLPSWGLHWGWQLNLRIPETYHVLIPQMSPSKYFFWSCIQSKLKVTREKSLLFCDHLLFWTKTIFQSMIDLIYRQPCLRIIWLPKIKSTLWDKFVQTQVHLKRTYYTFGRSQFQKVPTLE